MLGNLIIIEQVGAFVRKNAKEQKYGKKIAMNVMNVIPRSLIARLVLRKHLFVVHVSQDIIWFNQITLTKKVSVNIVKHFHPTRNVNFVDILDLREY